MKHYQGQVSKPDLSQEGNMENFVRWRTIGGLGITGLYPGYIYPHQSALVYNFRYDRS